MAAGLALACTKRQMLANSKIGGNFSQRNVFYERRAQAAQRTFTRLQPLLEYDFGNYRVQDSVSEKFEPRGVASGRASMLQCLR